MDISKKIRHFHHLCCYHPPPVHIIPQLKYPDSFLMGFLASTLVHVQAIPNTAARMILFTHMLDYFWIIFVLLSETVTIFPSYS